MKKLSDDRYRRKGFSLLWGFPGLSEVETRRQVITLRQFFRFIGDWDEAAPGSFGSGALVVGMEGVLDVMSFGDAETWLNDSLKPAVLAFQEQYAGERALILWAPSGRERVGVSPASGDFFWRVRGGAPLELGRILWGGASDGLFRVVDSADPKGDPEGPAWIGLHHTRIS